MSIRIESITTQRLNLRLRRPLQMSFGVISHQHVLLVRTRDTDGVEGVGEALVMGGPYWNADTIEGVRATVVRYAAPLIVGQAFIDLVSYSSLLHNIFRGNGAARSALEMSFIDLAGKKANQPAARMFGEAPVRDRIPVAWTLQSDDLEAALIDGERAILDRGHQLFKLKVGINDPAHEVAYARAIVRHFEGRIRLLVDANQAWTAEQALEILPLFRDAGVAAVEQPIAGHDLAGMVSIVRSCQMEVLADEAILGPDIAVIYARERAATGFALKPQRDGGLVDTLKVAAFAAKAGMACYGGTMLETSIGTAALAALYATVPNLSWGSELFGPLRLDQDLAIEPLIPVDGHIVVPTAAGLGVNLDEGRIKYLVERER